MIRNKKAYSPSFSKVSVFYLEPTFDKQTSYNKHAMVQWVWLCRVSGTVHIHGPFT